MSEAEIQKAVTFLAEAQRVFDRYCDLDVPSGIGLDPTAYLTKEVKPLPKEWQDKKAAYEKTQEAERKSATDSALMYLILLHQKVYDLWDAMEATADKAMRARLSELADATIQWIDMFEQEMGSSYDTLSADNTPGESHDRSGCHQRHGHEGDVQMNERLHVTSCPEESLNDLPCKDFEQYEDKQLAWAVNASFRTMVQLVHWINEGMTEKVFRYYVYDRVPCQGRLDTIAMNMDNLITHWQYYKPELSKTLRGLYSALQKAAKEADRRFRHLSILPYWNEKDFNPREVKACAAALHDKLHHIASMAYTDLERVDHTPNGPGQARAAGAVAKQDKRTPETDQKLIYQADAAEFYNIPKSTLSKAAKKKPSEPGYLWSDAKGKRRWYRKSDLDKISRSRRRLKGS
jgi:hypothetical protein